MTFKFSLPVPNGGSLSLELATDLKGHAYIASVRPQELTEILGEALRKVRDIGTEDTRTYRD